MSAMRPGDREGNDLDWESLQGPVPMDLIDPEFPAQIAQPAPGAAALGAASEILPREESDALAREAGARIPSEAAPFDAPAPAAPAAGPFAAPAAPSAGHPDPASEAPAVDPRATIAGGTWFGNQAVQDDFARIRAEMEAEAEAENRRKREAEQEEAAQRARLDQWMANARARLLKADADLTGPAGRVRLRKESSPSLYRLAEMQKTMDLSGEPTVPDGTRSLLAPAAPDPMATISVPADQFLKLDPATASGPAAGFPPLRPFPADRADDRPAGEGSSVDAFAPSHPPTGKFPAQAIPQAPAAFSVPTVIAGPQGWPAREAEEAPAAPVERSLAFPPEPAAPGADETHATRPLTREEALTRKVAKLRMAAEGGENTLMRSPLLDDEGDGRALNIAIAAMVLIAILVLGLGLFAATQAGLFDGMESRIPFLKPKVAMTGRSAPAPDIVEAPPMRPAAPAAPSGSSPDARPAPASGPAAAAALPAPSAPAAAPSSAARNAEAASRNGTVTPKPARPQARPSQAAPAPAGAKVRKGQAQSFPPSPPEEEIPAYARPRASGSAQTETLLRNAVESAAAMEKDELRELYNRYALGFPGLSGEVVVGLTVDPSGRILEASVVSSTTGVNTFDQDLVRKIVLWRLRSFPETRPKFISVPFLFPMQGH